MKRFFCVLFCLVSLFTFASEENGLGIVDDADLRAAGVKLENIKKAKYISEIYQRLIKSPCVLRIYDNNKEIYSFALKRLNQNDKNEIVISDEFLTDEFEVYLPSSSKENLKIQYLLKRF